MKAKDKIEVVSNIREQGLDLSQNLLAPLVAQVEKYANKKKLEPSEEPVVGAVERFVRTENKKFIAVLNDGVQINISPQFYQAESLYNFLPSRYRTMKL